MGQTARLRAWATRSPTAVRVALVRAALSSGLVACACVRVPTPVGRRRVGQGSCTRCLGPERRRIELLPEYRPHRSVLLTDSLRSLWWGILTRCLFCTPCCPERLTKPSYTA